ncbi:hypothetical protein D0Z00_004344 [Geotrichum galactomycetum]|uniref:Uncharacterized protein n=1 Tax=Geotrichum galactomycetum TaxID=27317 RepID=A0ACB6UYQ1_9ASCO|nr:hypothetical protein D0Z00_004344 [Geotrichum candidum]
MGGSQLKALKASLKSHGLIGQTNTKGKGKSKRSQDKNRQDKETVLASIRDAFSPFELKTTKQKADVVGRRVIGAVGRPGISKQAGEDNRRRALKAEMYQKNRVGGVVDRRFGENDASMNPEEKMLERFTRERQMKASKGSLFNLDDDDDDTYADGMGGSELLTHGGRALELNDDFDEGDLGLTISDDEETQRELREIRNKRKRLAEGGEIEEEEEAPKKKTREEVMKEVIAKSKMYKHERQMARQEDQNEIDKLDDKDVFNDLMSELREAGSFKPKESTQPGDKDEEYEQQVRAFAFDKRAVPTDRTKTDEEIAREKAAKLQELERKRLARMNGEEVSDDESSSSSESEAEPVEAPEYGNADEELNDAEAFGLKQATKHSDSEDEEDDDEDIMGNYEIDGDFHDFSGEEDNEEMKTPAKKNKVEKGASDSKAAAYTFECPESVDDLIDIFAQYPAKEYPTIIDRILTLYHPSLDKENKEKNSVLANVLAEYILVAGDDKPEDTDKDISIVLNKLISQLQTLAGKYNESLSEFFREKLNEAESHLQKSIESKKPSASKKTQSPSYLFLFTLIGLIYSTSDHFHQVVTPASLLIGQHLSQNKIRNLGDLFSGLYLCATVLSYQRLGKRYVPEVIQFLAKAVAMLAPEPAEYLPKDILIVQSQTEDIASAGYRKFAASAKDVKKLLKRDSRLALRDVLEINNGDKNKKSSALLYNETCRLVGAFFTLWSDKLSTIEMFTPFVKPVTVTNNDAVATKIQKLLKFAQQTREPLLLQAHRPIPIASNIPKFEENYSVDKKSYDPDQARQEISKLKAAIKKERKGALRELRKDSQFVARQKIADRRAHDKAYHEKMARLVNSINTEEGAEKNKYERERETRKKKNKQSK